MSESPTTPSGMRRQPRRTRSQERVNRILDVAEDLFASQGYTATTAMRKCLESTDYDAIAFVLVKAIGTLLWLSLSQEKEF